MKINYKKVFCAVLAVFICCLIPLARVHSKDNTAGQQPAEASYKKFSLNSELSVLYPDCFEVLYPGPLQNIISQQIANRSNVKLMFFAANGAGGDPKTAISESEYQQEVKMEDVINKLDSDAAAFGSIQKTEILAVTPVSAELVSSVFTGDGDIFKSKSRLLAVLSPDKKKFRVYYVSAGASFNNYFKYLPVIDSIIESAVIVEDGNESNGGK